MNFTDYEEFIRTVNQWVLDGSRIESFTTGSTYSEVTLRGRDGAAERLSHYIDEEDFNDAE